MKKVTIGKYTLESLTTGMYVDPFVLYREYIQNAADSIDNAIRKGVIKVEEGKIEVNILDSIGEINVIDNGTGIRKEEVYKSLLDIGNSKKRSNSEKGFRGIGRLSGLGYCDQIMFETSYIGENIKSIVVFDSIKLQNLLSGEENESLTLEEVITQSCEVNYIEEDDEAHYFKVTLKNVNNKLKLMEFKKVLNYLQENVPVPYKDDEFKFGTVINEELEKLDVKIDEYNIHLSNEDINVKVYKPYREKIVVDLKKRIIDNINDIEVKVIKNDLKGDKLVALVWYGKCSMFGTIADNLIKGLRIRKSGFLIGDRFSANSIFKEDRFNGWVCGEIIIFDKDIIPNARRDDFEKNNDYMFLIKKLNIIGEEISNEIRLASKKRNVKVRDNSKVEKKVSVTNKSIYKDIDLLVNKIADKNKIMEVFRESMIANNINIDIINKVFQEVENNI